MTPKATFAWIAIPLLAISCKSTEIVETGNTQVSQPSLVIDLSQSSELASAPAHFVQNLVHYAANQKELEARLIDESAQVYDIWFVPSPTLGGCLDYAMVSRSNGKFTLNDEILDESQLKDHLKLYKESADISDATPVLRVYVDESATLSEWIDLIRIPYEVGIVKLIN